MNLRPSSPARRGIHRATVAVGRRVEDVGRRIRGGFPYEPMGDVPEMSIEVVDVSVVDDEPITFIQMPGCRVDFPKAVPLVDGHLRLVATQGRFHLESGDWIVQGPCTLTYTDHLSEVPR